MEYMSINNLFPINRTEFFQKVRKFDNLSLFCNHEIKNTLAIISIGVRFNLIQS